MLKIVADLLLFLMGLICNLSCYWYIKFDDELCGMFKVYIFMTILLALSVLTFYHMLCMAHVFTISNGLLPNSELLTSWMRLALAVIATLGLLMIAFITALCFDIDTHKKGGN